MDALALLCNLHAEGPETLRRLRGAGVSSLEGLGELNMSALESALGRGDGGAERFLREASLLADRLGVLAPHAERVGGASPRGSAPHRTRGSHGATGAAARSTATPPSAPQTREQGGGPWPRTAASWPAGDYGSGGLSGEGRGASERPPGWAGVRPGPSRIRGWGDATPERSADEGATGGRRSGPQRAEGPGGRVQRRFEPGRDDAADTEFRRRREAAEPNPRELDAQGAGAVSSGEPVAETDRASGGPLAEVDLPRMPPAGAPSSEGAGGTGERSWNLAPDPRSDGPPSDDPPSGEMLHSVDGEEVEGEESALVDPEVGTPATQNQSVLAALLKAWQRTESSDPKTESPDPKQERPEEVKPPGAQAERVSADPQAEARSASIEEPDRQGSRASSDDVPAAELEEIPLEETDAGRSLPGAAAESPAGTPLAEMSTDQLGEAALASLRGAGIDSLEQLVKCEAGALTGQTGLRFTQLLRLQFLARRTLRRLGRL